MLLDCAQKFALHFDQSSIFLVQIRLLNKQIIWGLVIPSAYAMLSPGKVCA